MGLNMFGRKRRSSASLLSMDLLSRKLVRNVVPRRKRVPVVVDIALFVLRGTLGAFMMGHGAQKLFGAFGGHGLEGTGKWLESTGLRPGKPWAFAAGATEFGGGMLTALGFLNPIGPLGVIGSMEMATVKGHWGKPIWINQGGAELPVTNIMLATALGMAGPGRFSLDYTLKLRLTRWLLVPGILAATAVTVYGKMAESRLQDEQGQQPQQEQQGRPEETETSQERGA